MMWLFSLQFPRLQASAFAIALLASATPATAQAIIEGTWLSASGSQITITPCGADYCGAISAVLIPDDVRAQYGNDIAGMNAHYKDDKNKDAALRGRPLHGLPMLAVKATTNPWYFEGEVYNPQDGNTYSGAINVIGADAMMLKGCAVFVFCKEEQWTRVID